MSDHADLLESCIVLLDETLLELADRRPRPDLPTTCSDWTVADLCGHLEAIAGAYVLWGSAVLGDRTVTLRAGEDLARWNAEMIARAPRRDVGSLRLRWHELATDHLRLVRAAPARPALRMADDSLVTLDDHAGIAAVEWWLHGWDLRESVGLTEAGEELAPELVRVWRRVLAGPTGSRPGRGEPVAALLRASGREPR